MRNTWHDLETWSETPIKNGTHIYAENAEVMIWAFADGDGDVKVWDVINNALHYQDELSGTWVEDPLLEGTVPHTLMETIDDPEALVWFHNGGQFDFPVLSHAMPELLRRIPMSRWCDTMVQAFSHSLPGALEKLGGVLNIAEDKRKLKEGKKLVQLFCKPQGDAFFEKYGTRRATKQTHPAEWQRFIEYAGGDITTMREAHRLMPTWNWRGKHIDLWHCDLRINMRGFAVDLELANAAVKATDTTKAVLAKRTQDLTEGQVQAATQRDQMLKYILEAHGVELPDMQADTLERRMQDENLPDAVRELLGIRLLASMNSAAKYKALLKGVSSDGRLRGTMQFRGAGRTGRVAHRLFQPGNMMRPTLEAGEIEQCIEWLKLEYLDAIELSFAPLMEVLGNAVRGTIIAPPGRKLVVADLANIEGRMAAWLAGEEWKLQAFHDYDTFLLDEHGQKIPAKKKGEWLRKGLDLYVKSYMGSFNVVDAGLVGKDERQIGKVCLAKGTLVLTNSGWLPIEQVTTEHKLWDGEEWISHMGLLSQGVKPVIDLGALFLTPDHSVLCGTQWMEAATLLHETTAHSRALETGAAVLPSKAIWWGLLAGLRQCSFVAIAGALSTLWRRTTSVVAAAVGALRAPRVQSPRSVGGNTLMRCLKQNIAPGFFSGWLQRAFVVPRQTTQGGSTTVLGGYVFVTSGSKTEQLFSRMCEHFRDGMTRSWRWTVRTLTGTTSLATSSSSPNARTYSTDAEFLNYRPRSTTSEKRMPTFDLACAGPRKRFTAMSAKGPLIVHNCELMFQYGGGVGAWLTGAATYGINLDKMTEQVWDTLPQWAKDEAGSFMCWLYEPAEKVLKKTLSEGFDDDGAHHKRYEAAKRKVRFGLSEKTFITCDAIKRLWRKAHPQISSYWTELEDAVKYCIANPNETLACRKLKIRRSGNWLRICLPSGRELCYPGIGVETKGPKAGSIYYTGQDAYTKQWGKVYTYGGKLFENVVQAAAADQLVECWPIVEAAGYEIVLDVHDENVCEVLDDPRFSADRLASLMCSLLEWNEGLPLAAAGSEMPRYAKT